MKLYLIFITILLLGSVSAISIWNELCFDESMMGIGCYDDWEIMRDFNSTQFIISYAELCYDENMEGIVCYRDSGYTWGLRFYDE